MNADPSTSPWLVAAIVFVLAGALFVLAGLAALVHARPLVFTLRTLAGALLVALGALAGMVGLGTQGYRALTREEVAARIEVRPTAAQRFEAAVHFADGRVARFDVAGDEIVVDAHVLKWRPVANLLGLHTAYELDRLSGRYRDIAQERGAERTVHALAPDRPVDLFRLRSRFAALSALVDAEYGSASFVPVRGPGAIEVRVSTSGLLMRPLDGAAQ
jgi:hypothetical protein